MAKSEKVKIDFEGFGKPRMDPCSIYMNYTIVEFADLLVRDGWFKSRSECIRHWLIEGLKKDLVLLHEVKEAKKQLRIYSNNKGY